MDNRFFTFIANGALLLTAAVVSFVVIIHRRNRRHLTKYKERIRRGKIALVQIGKCICIGIGVKASPIFIWGGLACLLFFRHEINAAVVLYLIGSSVLITVLWITLDNRINYREIDIAFDLHDHIEAMDRISTSEMIEGLNHIKFVEPYVPGEPPDYIQMRAMINEIARDALIPSVYRNHHCREITSYDDPVQYFKTKRDLVVDAFHLGHHEDYMQLVLNRLPDTVTFEEAVDSYISILFVDVFGPSLIRCCETKIAYYELVMCDWSMSGAIRGKARYFKIKNEQYIERVRDICNHSTIIGSAIKSRERT